jgi:hypothetical protein
MANCPSLLLHSQADEFHRYTRSQQIAALLPTRPKTIHCVTLSSGAPANSRCIYAILSEVVKTSLRRVD